MRHYEPVARVLWALQRNGFDPKPWGADRWVSRCPSHQGRRRNLSIGAAMTAAPWSIATTPMPQGTAAKPRISCRPSGCR